MLGFGRDLLGGLGPRERLAAFVVGIDEDLDRADQVGHTGESATADGLPGDDPEEDLHQVEPGTAGRGEVQRDPRVAGQPGAYFGGSGLKITRPAGV